MVILVRKGESMSEFKISMLGDYTKIETEEINVYINNISIKKISIKKEDNGKPIILVEAKQ